MARTEVSADLNDWDWKEALEALGLDDWPGSCEALYELYETELRGAMQDAGTKRLRDLLKQSAIQSAFKLRKLKPKPRG